MRDATREHSHVITDRVEGASRDRTDEEYAHPSSKEFTLKSPSFPKLYSDYRTAMIIIPLFHTVILHYLERRSSDPFDKSMIKYARVL